MKRFFGALYIQVLIGVVAGILLGVFVPKFGSQLKPLADAFILLIKMLFAPIIFGTVVLGIAKMENMKELGRVGARALLYFEIMSTFALFLGLFVVNVFEPGKGMNINPATLDTKALSAYTAAASKPATFVDFLLHMIPVSIVDALAKNEVLQILVFAILLGAALSKLGARATPVVGFMEALLDALFSVVGMVMYLAPIAACGALAFTVGKYGLASMLPLGKLVACMFATCAVFIVVVLGAICRLAGFSLFKLLKYLKDELLTVFATGSSESVLPQVMRKLEHVGCSKPVVGLVIPSGLTFNPDGQCIYYTMAAIFVAQITNTPLSMTDQLVILGVLMLTSKGSAGVSGAGFITLAATLASLGKIPVSGMVLLLGVDRFLTSARAITNTTGNAVGTMVIARWVGALNMSRAQKVLDGEALPEEELPKVLAAAQASDPRIALDLKQQ
jgi:aerobic C4-dicarboxylate transport protein